MLSKNFTYEEFACPCCNRLIVDPTFLRVLQDIRSKMGVAFPVTSGYRCEKHNKSLPNSSPISNHMKGKAVDISTANWSGRHLHEFLYYATYATNNESSGVGIYRTFIHFDLRDEDYCWIGF